MAITLDVISALGDAAVATVLNITHTFGGSDRYGFCNFATNAGGVSATSVVIDPGGGDELAMAEVYRVSTAGMSGHMWGVVAPPTGTFTVRITMPGLDNIAGRVISWTGVDQSTPIGTAVTHTDTGTSATVDVSSESGDLVIDSLGQRDATGLAAGGGQTQRWQDTGTNDNVTACSTEPGAGTVTISWSWTNSTNFGYGAVNINAAAAAGNPKGPLGMPLTRPLTGPLGACAPMHRPAGMRLYRPRDGVLRYAPSLLRRAA